ncbi:hypothetical protein EW026_g4883 [Hermanssonia centrifuga]|nr:hypothetical protein EW026_g4883 [Hermanssonia centrifuga]
MAHGVQLVKAGPSYDANPELRHMYQSMIGTLLYLMLGTRPDISFAVTKLSQFMSNPTSEHMAAVKHIFRYLNGNRHLVIRYDGLSGSGLIGYVDSDWAEDKDDRHSIMGSAFFMANGVVSWVSRKQKTVALSSTEAEYMALSDTCRQISWLRQFESELGYAQTEPTPLCVDNQGAIFLASNPAHDRRTKHIDIRYHFVREFLEGNYVKFYYVPSADNIADVLTKPLAKQKHMDLSGRLGLTNDNRS